MITVIGSAVLDIILKVKEENFERGEKIEVENFEFSLGGGALNASLTFKKLGLKPEIYFHLGKDFLGEIIKNKVKKLKLKTKVFYHREATTFSVIILPPSKERIIFVHRGKLSEFKINELNKVKINPYIYITPGNTPSLNFLKFFKKVRNKVKFIAINPSKKFLEEKLAKKTLSFTDFVFLNDEELRILNQNFKKDLILLGKETLKEIKVKALIVTLGEKGSLVFTENKILKAGIFKPQEIVDKTGAGDAFASAFFGKIVIEKEFNENVIKSALLWGSANASSVIQKLGAQNGVLNKREYRFYKNLDIKEI